VVVGAHMVSFASCVLFSAGACATEAWWDGHGGFNTYCEWFVVCRAGSRVLVGNSFCHLEEEVPAASEASSGISLDELAAYADGKVGKKVKFPYVVPGATILLGNVYANFEGN
jgi:hypothetical protein